MLIICVILFHFGKLNGTKLLNEFVRFHVSTTDSYDQTVIYDLHRDLFRSKLVPSWLYPPGRQVKLCSIQVLSKAFIDDVSFGRLVESRTANIRDLVLKSIVLFSDVHLLLVDLIHLCLKFFNTLSVFAIDFNHVVCVIGSLIDAICVHPVAVGFDLYVCQGVILQLTSLEPVLFDFVWNFSVEGNE